MGKKGESVSDKKYSLIDCGIDLLLHRITALTAERDALAAALECIRAHCRDSFIAVGQGRTLTVGEIVDQAHASVILAALKRRVQNEALEEAAVTCETFGGLDGTHLAASAIRAMKEPE